ncbi:MAG: YbhB/YbcL family Raf kinase inhibitor-like protein [Chloroflexi bacterium]|nr:YbhB/YbcL family Raf kinase inhibitor-like protein [Chloroflexota bacterium]
MLILVVVVFSGGCQKERPAASPPRGAGSYADRGTPSPTHTAPEYQASPALQLQSPAFEHQGPIPRRYTCDGEDISPPLTWGPAPKATRSWVLIMDDPDAPAGTWDHWIVYDIPAEVTQLVEGATPPGRQGRNSWGRIGYGGPCPPPGPPHHYVFRIYALDIPSLGLPEGATKAQVLQAMQDHILAQATLIGTYGR